MTEDKMIEQTKKLYVDLDEIIIKWMKSFADNEIDVSAGSKVILNALCMVSASTLSGMVVDDDLDYLLELYVNALKQNFNIYRKMDFNHEICTSH